MAAAGHLRRRRVLGAVLATLCALAGAFSVCVLFVLLGSIVSAAWTRLDWTLLSHKPDYLDPTQGGVRPAFWGTVWLMGLTGLVAVPVGVGAAVYLQEFARRNWFTSVVTLNIANLAGVPSIVYAILGLAVFIQTLGLGRSLLTGALTLALLSMPIIIIATREALLAVPKSLREAAYALGATRRQTVRHHVLPAALPGIMTGVILALSRAIGEAAPLVIIGAFAEIDHVPGEGFTASLGSPQALMNWLNATIMGDFTTLPIQIYSWATKPDEDIRTLASAAIVVLLVLMLMMNALAVGIRAWHQRGTR
jgi:phosphate transport system permease protein